MFFNEQGIERDVRESFAAYSFSTGNRVRTELWDLLVDGLRAGDFLALHE